MDASVPLWRFQRKGLDDIVAQHRDWYPAPARIVEWTATPTGSGPSWSKPSALSEGGEEMYSRSIHLLHVEDNGRIAPHVLYCTGDWDQATVERQVREAPMHQR